jgi:hypothetical protein
MYLKVLTLDADGAFTYDKYYSPTGFRDHPIPPRKDGIRGLLEMSLRGGGGDDESSSMIDEDEEFDNSRTMLEDEDEGPTMQTAAEKMTVALRGGGPNPPWADGNNGVWFDKAPDQAKWLPLYGYQGIVHFEQSTFETFADAVARLLNLPTLQSAQVDIFSVDVLRKVSTDGITLDWGLTEQTGFDEVLGWLQDPNDRARGGWFVSHRGVATPKYASPVAANRADGAISLRKMRVIQCTLKGSLRGDVAYLRMPENADSLSSNQYGPWMRAVARVLTPGLAKSTPGFPTIPHAFVGLGSDTAAPDAGGTVETYGGLGFSNLYWGKLFSLWSKTTGQDEVKVEIDGLPSYDVGIYLPGACRGKMQAGQTDMGVDVKNLDSLPDVLEKLCQQNCATGDWNTTKNGKTSSKSTVQLEVWCPGQDVLNHNSTSRLINVERKAPDLVKSFSVALGLSTKSREHGWVACRPRFAEYKAWNISNNQNFTFDISGTLVDFRKKMKTYFIHTDKDIFARTFRIQTKNAALHNAKGKGKAVAAAAPATGLLQSEEDKKMYRLDFHINPSTTEAEWRVMCNQIVDPEIDVVTSTLPEHELRESTEESMRSATRTSLTQSRAI